MGVAEYSIVKRKMHVSFENGKNFNETPKFKPQRESIA